MSSKALGYIASGIEEVRNSWGWFLALGILFVLLGTICVIGNVTATFATVLFCGWMLVVSGVSGLVQTLRMRNWQGALLTLLSALFRGFLGYLLIRYPLSGAVSLTLILASFLLAGGAFRAVGSGMMQFPRWGWSVFSGLVSVALGIMLLAQLPVSSVWFIGFAIGVDLICDGASLVALSTSLHSLPDLAVGKAS